MNNPLALRLLVVDDEAAIRQLCQRTLAGMGYAIETAQDGAEALDLFRQKAFDIVLTDLSMPGAMNGERLLDEIKKRAPTTDVIIMTGFPALETAIPTLKQGAYDYLIKPFDQAVLKSTINRCWEKRQLSNELSREKRLREDLEAAYAQLQEMEQLKEAFLARVNHEFRIPLVPAILAVDLLSDSVKDEESVSLCNMARERLTELRELIESVLLFSQLKRPNYPFTQSPVFIKNLLSHLINRFHTAWEEQQLKVNLYIDPKVNVFSGDAGLLEIVCKQLFLNAIHFNQKGGCIMIRAFKKGAAVEIVFEDTGIGIPEDKLTKVFDGFYQVADYLTREVGGVGLGLALVKRILEAQGGTIAVKSQWGSGSQFIVRLPVSFEVNAEKEVVLQ